MKDEKCDVLEPLANTNFGSLSSLLVGPAAAPTASARRMTCRLTMRIVVVVVTINLIHVCIVQYGIYSRERRFYFGSQYMTIYFGRV